MLLETLKMEHRRPGTSGLGVSELALGKMQFGWTADEETVFAIMGANKAHSLGIAHVAPTWLLTNPLITAPIFGAHSIRQWQRNPTVVGFRLSDDGMHVLNETSDRRKA
jgi:aryl-alcohol dehydrogenase-like predicted oxidoreductase